MEIFVDFGVFEVVVALGLAAVARKVYARRLLAGTFVSASVLMPVALVFLTPSVLTRWLAAGSLATALVNAAWILMALRWSESGIAAQRVSATRQEEGNIAGTNRPRTSDSNATSLL